MTTDNFAFPESDREWMSLQQRVIDLTGKPIEDVAWGELGTLRAALTAAQMNAVLSYRRHKRVESSAPCAGVKARRRDPEGWKDWKCDKDYSWMLFFQDRLRLVLFTIHHHYTDKNYEQLLLKIRRELSRTLDGYPDRAWEPQGGGSWLLSNIPMIFPNDEGFKLLTKWRNQLRKREKQLERNPEPPKDLWLEVHNRRQEDFKKVCQKAMEAGLLYTRGPHLYFNGKHIANGTNTGILTIKDYELEAEIRVAVKRLAETSQAKEGGR